MMTIEPLKNWMGLLPHWTDPYVHWSSRRPQKDAQQLREFTDSIPCEYLHAVQELYYAAREAGRMDEAESREEF